MRLGPRKLQGKQQKTRDGQGLRRQQLRDIAVLLSRVGAQEKRQRIKQIERPIRHDGPGPERYGVLPGKSNFGHATALCGEPVGKAIGAVKNYPRSQELDARRFKRGLHACQASFTPSPPNSR